MKNLLLVVMLLSLYVKAQKGKLYDLAMGDHEVGFKIITVYDLSRPPVYTSDIYGKLGKLQNEHGRRIRISVWYPAVKKPSPQMNWEDYVAELAPAGSPKGNLFGEGLAIYLEGINDLRDKPLTKKELDELRGLSMNAHKNADNEKGRFPLLLFPAYQSPTKISILAEYLTSHGFVVASVGLTGTESEIPEISPQGIQTMTLDLLFALNYMRTKSFVDIGKLAAMGVGINATAVFSLKAATAEVDALISLEGGILSASEMQFLRRSVSYDPTKFQCPSLFIYAPHPSIQPNNVEELKYADKYFIQFAKMSEYYFLDFGMLDRFIPGIIGTPPGNVKRGYELAAGYVLQFLQFSLNNDKHARDGLMSANVSPFYDSVEVTKSFVPGLPAVPSLAQLENLIATKGISSFQEIYRKARATSSQPFTQQYLTDLYNWLAYKRDPDYTSRKAIAEALVESYPVSSRAHFALANVCFQMNNKETAILHYKEALKLLTGDPDSEVTPAVRQRIETVSAANLKKLE